MEINQKKYEIGYLLSPLVAEERIDEEVGVLRKAIEDKHGMIVVEGRPKMQRLAYPIKHLPAKQTFEMAQFGWIKFVCMAENIAEIEDAFKKNEKIVRFLVMSIPPETARKKNLRTGKPGMRKKPASTEGGKTGDELTIKPEEVDKKLQEMLEKSDAVK